MCKTLSIVIPTYNMENYLHRCLDSLLVDNIELFERLEVLVVNDGSKDSSSAIAHEYQDKYPNVFRVIDKENGNYGSCINIGLYEAKGKYFKVLDADDWYNKNTFSNLINKLGNCDSDLCITNYIYVGEDLKPIRSVKIPEGYDGKTVSFENFHWELDADPMLLSMHAFCVRRSLLIDNNYKQQEGISYTDTEYNYFCLLYSKTLTFWDLSIYNYLIGREGQTISPSAAVKNSSHFYRVGQRLMEDYYKRMNQENPELLKNLNIPIKKISFSFFYTELLIKGDKFLDKVDLDNYIQSYKKCMLSIDDFKYHHIKYVCLYLSHSLSSHWFYCLVEVLKKIVGK